AEFTEQIRTAFPQKEIVHNALWFVGVSDPSVQREIVAADVIELERGVNDGGIVHGGGTYGFDTLLGYIDWIHAHGRNVWFNATAGTDAARLYGLAAYFLTSSGSDCLGNSPGDAPGDWWSGYDAFLGSASGPRYAWSGVLRRDFDRGIVLLNTPGSTQQTVALGAVYTNLVGQQVSSVTLGGAQGAVLLRPTSTPPAPAAVDVVPVQQ